MRYAPAFGAGVMALTDALGWTNKPDYTNADMVVNSAHAVNPIGAPVIGNYLTYNPLDRNYYMNQMQAAANASNRALINQSNGNRA
jgi:hypothetical protein